MSTIEKAVGKLGQNGDPENETGVSMPPAVGAVEKAVSQGALILIDSNDDNFDFRIRGKKFKLAYLFSLLFYLPLRNYPSIKLSDCLKGIRPLNQKTLFD